VTNAAADIARDFEAANDEAVRFAEACTTAQWGTLVPGENWSVGVVLHHIAVGHLQCLRWLGHLSGGEAVPDTAAQIDADNAQHARDCADVGITETVEALRANGARLAGFMRSLGDDQLARSAPFGPGNGVEVTTDQLAAVASRHCRVHLAAARDAAAPGAV
jgi:hypothetical protein